MTAPSPAAAPAISTMVTAALRALDGELQSSSAPSPQDNLYRRTISAFRPRQSTQGRGRGHHRTQVKLQVFLLGMPMAVVPSKREQRELCQRGLGSPARLSSCSFKKNWTLEEVQQHILSLYPGIPLDVCGYTLGKSSKSRRLNRVEFQSVDSLKKQVKKGKLFIIPKAEIQPSQNGDNRTELRNLEQSPMESTVVEQTGGPENINSAENEVQQSERQGNSTESEEVLPELTTPNSNRQRREAALVARCQIREWCDTRGADQSTSEPLENQANNSEELSDNHSVLSTGTPTIQFRRRRPSLSLNRHTSGNQQSAESASTSVFGRQENYLEILDSEDEELQQAVEASLRDSELSNSLSATNQEPCLEEVLSSFKRKAVNEHAGRSSLIVFRKRVLDSAFDGIQRPGFHLDGNLYVKFSGEMGQDYGGPRREFFRLALKELHSSSMFIGDEGNKGFKHDIQQLESKRYQMAGRLVGLSLAHDGPGPNFINKTLFKFMVGETTTDFIDDVRNILDDNAMDVLDEMLALQTQQEVEEFLIKYGDWILDQGISNVYRLNVGNKGAFAQQLMKQQLYYRTSAEIQQFCMGINEIGKLWDVVNEHPSLFCELFCLKTQQLTKSVIENLVSFDHSEEGSNRRSEEDETVYAWELFLQDVEEGRVELSLEDLLIFITGADKVPPCGFNSSITVKFYEKEEGVRRLPYASTCSMELYLPRGARSQELRELLIVSLTESYGFGKI